MQNKSDLYQLRDDIRHFVEERDWSKFHTPKNVATAICIEASELLEPFQWLDTGSVDELGTKRLSLVRQEMADVFMNLLRLSDLLDIDLMAEAHNKLQDNRHKYPVDRVRGDARKYSEYD
ncbi:nucleotide pyrophosphohydrolase [Arenimonas sp.]|uniref:nucleotide pyrophosphohydrolase n=1 Tax=Arenimonas sp. TaxID=1872635 RepID=UPI0039E4E302